MKTKAYSPCIFFIKQGFMDLLNLSTKTHFQQFTYLRHRNVVVKISKVEHFWKIFRYCLTNWSILRYLKTDFLSKTQQAKTSIYAWICKCVMQQLWRAYWLKNGLFQIWRRLVKKHVHYRVTVYKIKPQNLLWGSGYVNIFVAT